MEVHRQTCQACGSINIRNILARERGRAQMVYVRCAECSELVARYRLRDYYHHGKSAESFYRSMGAGDSESARDQLEEFSRMKEEAIAGYERALEILQEAEKEV